MHLFKNFGNTIAFSFFFCFYIHMMFNRRCLIFGGDFFYLQHFFSIDMHMPLTHPAEWSYSSHSSDWSSGRFEISRPAYVSSESECRPPLAESLPCWSYRWRKSTRIVLSNAERVAVCRPSWRKLTLPTLSSRRDVPPVDWWWRTVLPESYCFKNSG